MTPYKHSVSSARKFGGKPEDYFELHSWFDESKIHYPNFTHRALRHHTLGILECEQIFGICIPNSEGKNIPTRLLAEQHILEDCGRIPVLKDWFRHFTGKEKWMSDPEKLSSEENSQKQTRDLWVEAVIQDKTEESLEDFSRKTKRKAA